MAKINSTKVDANEEGAKNKKKTTKKSRAVAQEKNTAKKSAKISKKKDTLTFITPIIITALIVGGGIYLWQNSVSQKSINQAKDTTTDFFQKKLSEIESENTELKTVNEELESKAKLLDDAKKQFISEELGIAFLYPAVFGDVSLTVSEGETGEIFRGNFSNNDKLSFGGVSQSFSRATTTALINVLDTYGFKKRWTGYYFKHVSEQAITDYKIEPLDVIKLKSSVVLVDKDSFDIDQENARLDSARQESQVIGLGENHLAALVNLRSYTFGGIVFLNQDVDNFSLIEFGAMLETVEVK